jgi:hypothetical protein
MMATPAMSRGEGPTPSTISALGQDADEARDRSSQSREWRESPAQASFPVAAMATIATES